MIFLEIKVFLLEVISSKFPKSFTDGSDLVVVGEFRFDFSGFFLL